MTCWYEGPLAAFDTETTGVDVESDRIVSAAIVVQDAAGSRPRVSRWLVNPGVPVPAGATEVHGLTDEHLQRNGRWPAPVMEEIARLLGEQAAAGRPLVVMNAPFDLTLLDRELRRHRASALGRYMESSSLCVLDPRVLDKHLDRYRKGRRTLTDLCAHYEVELEGAHDAAADAQASLDVVRAVGRRFASRLERLSPAELHTLQAVWHAAQARGLQAWFARSGNPETVDPAWPMRTELREAA
ncbi:3'-5' exonuclease [Streptomyces sp. NPDC057684]|jgi:DNA polymerase-3 subunit epsilon|uniref:3'-5' exonuclease n=1 Tax=Streptomyces sp. NBC_00119 TaxID=2975659 RepID=A0AAU1UIE5_9ACTN|nr:MULTISPECIES: 3'-5' exonuclease [unclassified Streptomyces]MCX4646672.1 3'-5' exonuclease [Streptomyces sp. NBC_01446]MCX5319302.1 3'-5' exonuclease [Streptomyces sp. NBC_00120]MCX5436088.1 3'-5' exonuclease [Streptomyces sp. NBC_00063]RFC76225.1 3'-5' exonuclease [Streptomyces sp. AcE210]WUB97202.1 3'-5' exonuclease [Streptomyces sp. NBC_00569]